MICIKDFKGRGINGEFDIKAGTVVELVNNYLCYKGRIICREGSYIAKTFFRSNVTAK